MQNLETRIPEWWGASEGTQFATLAALMGILANQEPREANGYVPDRYVDHTLLTPQVLEKIGWHDYGLEQMGLSAREYLEAYAAAYAGETNILRDIAARGNASLKLTPGQNIELSQENLRVVEEFVAKRLKDVEPGKEASVVIVSGPFASGKSELGVQDGYVIDLDEIRKELIETRNQAYSQALVEELKPLTWAIGDALALGLLGLNRTVIIQSALHREERVLEDPTFEYVKERNIPIDMIVILRPVTDCMCRNLHRRRVVNLGDLWESMAGMRVLPQMLTAYPNIQSITLLDYYPAYQRQVGMIPRAFYDDYLALIDLAKSRPDLFAIVEDPRELEVEE